MMDDEHQQIGPESAAPRHIPQHDRSPGMSAPDRPTSSSRETGGPWLPDGHGLDPLSIALVEERTLRVHLRLTSPGGRSARGACGQGLGELWSGVAGEVTCPDCLEVVHA